MFNWQPRSRLVNDERGRVGGGSALYVIPALLGPLAILGGAVAAGGFGVLYGGARLATM